MLTFDEAQHQYHWRGVPVPNVTRILAPLIDLNHIPADVLETARQKGVAVHKMVELDAKGDLDEDTLPEWMRPVLDKWREFVRDTNFVVFNSEHRVYHPQYRYAGTLDLFGHMGPEKQYVLIDVKRSFMAGAVIGLQTAAYQAALTHDTHSTIAARAKRYALRLNENGPYRLELYQNQNDWNTFLALLTIHRWREANLKGA